MLYTEDFTMHHYVGFSQIGSHMIIKINFVRMTCIFTKFTFIINRTFYENFIHNMQIWSYTAVQTNLELHKHIRVKQ